MIFGISGTKLSVIERCPYYRGVRKERLDCNVIVPLYFWAHAQCYVQGFRQS